MVQADRASGNLNERLRAEIGKLRQQLATEREKTGIYLAVAEQVHRSLLPSPIRTARLDVDVRYLPIEAVGGDYCQVRFPNPETCYVTICDVAGHGLGAALIASRVSSEVRRFIMDGLRPQDIVRSLNEFIFEYFQEAHLFLSFMAARIDFHRETVTISGAGHPPALHICPVSSSVHAIDSQNIVLGVNRDCLAREAEHTRPFVPGDRLLLYTDGVTEARNALGRQLGSTALKQLAAEAISSDTFRMADQILEQVSEFRHGPATDDMTLIVVERK